MLRAPEKEWDNIFPKKKRIKETTEQRYIELEQSRSPLYLIIYNPPTCARSGGDHRLVDEADFRRAAIFGQDRI